MIITVHNGRCDVDANRVETYWLDKLLTVEATDKTDRNDNPVKCYFYEKDGKWFPTGMLPMVLDKCDDEIKLVDKRTKLKLPARPAPIEGFTYRDYQKDGVKGILKQKRGTVEVATNGGKSIMIAGLLKTIEKKYGIGPDAPRAIVIVHREEIFNQLQELLSKTLGSMLGVITSKKVRCKKTRVTLAMVSTLRNRIGANPDVTRLFENHQILLADEAHHLQAKTWYDLFMNSDASVRVGFSGTIPEDGTYASARVRAATGDRIISVTNRELIDAGHSADTSVEMLSYDSSDLFPKGFYKAAAMEYSRLKLGGQLVFEYHGGLKNAKVRGAFFSWYQRKCLDVGMINNNRRTAEFAKRILARPDKQHLVITERIQHGENMRTMLRDLGQDVDFVHGDVKGRNEMVRKFRDGKLRILIATTVLDEGVDIDRIDVLMLAGCMKSVRAMKQRLGRSLRKKKKGPNVALVVDVTDKGNKYLERYSAEREKVWEEEGLKIERFGG